MHYRFNAFAMDRSQPTIKSKYPTDTPTRQLNSRSPTDKDLLKIRRMYNCEETSLHVPGAEGYHGGDEYYDDNGHHGVPDDYYGDEYSEGNGGPQVVFDPVPINDNYDYGQYHSGENNYRPSSLDYGHHDYEGNHHRPPPPKESAFFHETDYPDFDYK